MRIALSSSGTKCSPGKQTMLRPSAVGSGRKRLEALTTEEIRALGSDPNVGPWTE
jgi:hypothetical protein